MASSLRRDTVACQMRCPGGFAAACLRCARRNLSRSVRPATTDAELAAAVRTAAEAVGEHARTWRRSADWRGGRVEARTYTAAVNALTALAALPADASPRTLEATLSPILGAWWPSYPPAAAATADAVDRLRQAVNKRFLVESARGFVHSGLVGSDEWHRQQRAGKGRRS
jgi:hypothetical protein